MIPNRWDKMTRLIIPGISVLLVAILIAFFGPTGTGVFADEEFCNGIHNDSCYEEGTAKHRHTDYRGKTSTADTNSRRGGCYNEFHAGTHESYPCYGSFSFCEYYRELSRHYYSCSCNTNEEYLKYGGVGINGPYTTTIYYTDTGYTEENVGHCSRCGAAATICYDYTNVYKCSTCGKKTMSPGPHEREYNTSDYYEADCGKSGDVYYHDNGDGEEAAPVCGRTVISLVPSEARQICSKTSVNESLNRRATAYFKDGHREEVICTVNFKSEIKYNEWQPVSLSYGEYHMDTDDKRPQKGSTEVTIYVYVQGLVTACLETDNPSMGRPFFENGKESVSAEPGTYILCHGGACKGYHVKCWKLSDGSNPVGKYEDGNAEIFVQDYDMNIICVYEANTYKAFFDAGGGHFIDGTDRREKDVLFGRIYGEVETPVKDGYVFAGWQLVNKADSSPEKAFISAEYDIVEVAEDHVLTAIWSEKGPGFTYLEYDDKFDRLFEPVTHGYDFRGWFLQEENNKGTGLKADESLYLKYEYAFNGNTITKDKNNYVVYADFEPKIFKITFVCGKNEYISSGEQLTNFDGTPVLYNVTRPGNVFDSDKAVKSVRYGDKFNDMPVALRLDDDGIAEDDCVFVGWSTDGSAEGLVTSNMPVDIEKNITVHPLFLSAGECIVTLDPNGGEMHSFFTFGSAENPFSVKVGKAYGSNLGYYPTFLGHRFSGWSMNREGTGNLKNTISKVLTDKDHTLYARWEHYVNYDANNTDIYGNSLRDNCFGTTAKNVFINDDKRSQIVNANGFYRPFYRFVGWNTERDGSGTWYCNENDITDVTPAEAKRKIGKELSGTIILYAQWDSRIDIILDLRGGGLQSGEEDVLHTFIGKEFPENVPVPEKKGFYFKGFYTGTDGSGVKVYDKRGMYCLEDASLAKMNGRAMFVPENRIFVGKTSNSILWADSFVSLPELDRLYACWGEGEEPAFAEPESLELIMINNDSVKERDENGMPIAHKGNKLTFEAVLSCGEDFDKVKVTAEIEFENADGDKLIMYSTTGENGVIKTFLEFGNDIYPSIEFINVPGSETEKEVFKGDVVVPYLSYFVKSSEKAVFEDTAQKNTLWGNEEFFVRDTPVRMILRFKAENCFGDSIEFENPVVIILK